MISMRESEIRDKEREGVSETREREGVKEKRTVGRERGRKRENDR